MTRPIALLAGIVGGLSLAGILAGIALPALSPAWRSAGLVWTVTAIVVAGAIAVALKLSGRPKT